MSGHVRLLDWGKTGGKSPSEWAPWEGVAGGEIRTRAEGKATYYLRRRLADGRRFEGALGHSPQEAFAELALFERDPLTYRSARQRAKDGSSGVSSVAPVRLDAETLAAFLKWCKAEAEAGRLTEGYVVGTLKPYLTQWGAKLERRDLHAVRLEEIQGLLAGWETARHKRTVAIKAFTAWARETKAPPRLQLAKDPTLGLHVPPAAKRQKEEARKGYSMDFVERFYRAIPDQTARDMLRLRIHAAGAHGTELGRIARGEARLERLADPRVAGVVCFWQAKKKEWHPVTLDAEAFAAAERLRARGSTLTDRQLTTLLHTVAIQLHGCGGVPRVYKTAKRIAPCDGCALLHPNELRHSFATWAEREGKEVFPVGRRGVRLDIISERMGHNSKATTKGFYLGNRVPSMIALPALKLLHPEDPHRSASSAARRSSASKVTTRRRRD